MHYKTAAAIKKIASKIAQNYLLKLAADGTPAADVAGGNYQLGKLNALERGVGTTKFGNYGKPIFNAPTVHESWQPWSDEANRQREWVRHKGNYDVPGVEAVVTPEMSAQDISDEKIKDYSKLSLKEMSDLSGRDIKRWSRTHNPDGSKKLPRYVYPNSSRLNEIKPLLSGLTPTPRLKGLNRGQLTPVSPVLKGLNGGRIASSQFLRRGLTGGVKAVSSTLPVLGLRSAIDNLFKGNK